MTRDAVPHGPTSPLSDVQPHPGTSGARGYAERQIAAEGRAAGPTDADLVKATVRAIEQDERAYEVLTDSLAGFEAWVEVVVAAALPLIEARLRAEIAAERVGDSRPP